jgi:hypothetical protein
MTKKSPFPAVKPWPKKVDGEKLLHEMRDVFTKYIVLPEGAADALALWALHTHAIESAFFTPLLGLLSPEYGCGKSHTMTLLEELCARTILTSNISTAQLYRVTEDVPTLLIDEADSFLKISEQSRGIINSGRSRRGSRVLRCENDTYKTQVFSTFCPAAIAIAKEDLPESHMTRAIIIRMFKAKANEKFAPFDEEMVMEDCAPLRSKCARWAKDNVEWLKENRRPSLPKSLYNRTADKWRILVAIADRAGGYWRGRSRYVAKMLEGLAERTNKKADGNTLLADIREVYEESGEDFLPTTDLLSFLLKLDGSLWSHYDDDGRELTPEKISVLLTGYGISPKKKRMGAGKRARGYERQDFEPAWERYLTQESPFPAPSE